MRTDIPVAEYHPVGSVNGSAIPIEVESESRSTSKPFCSIIGMTVGKSEQTQNEEEQWRSICQQQNLEGFQGAKRNDFVPSERV